MRYVCVFICFLLWLIFTLLLSFTVKGDTPCPFCNTEKFIEYDPFSKENEFYEGIENEEKAKEMSREWYLNWINSKKI